MNYILFLLSLLFIFLGLKDIDFPINYIILLIGSFLIFFSIYKIIQYFTDNNLLTNNLFTDNNSITNFIYDETINYYLNIIIFGPLLVILGLTQNESLKHLSFIIGITIIISYIKNKYNIDIFNKF